MVGLARDLTVQPQWHGGLSARGGGVRPAPRAVEVRVLPFPERSFGQGLQVTREEATSVLSESGPHFEGAAAVIIDYTQGGCYSTPAYQDEVARLAEAAGVLWIADEVITGFGKSGVWFNFQRGEARPDIVTLGKGMGGGVVPAAGIVLSKRVLELIGDAAWQNYSSLRSTDMAAAASRAFVEIVAEDALVPRVDRLHELVCDEMQQLAATHPSVKRIDGRGLHWWVEMKDGDWKEWRGDVADPPLAKLVAQKTLEAGALVTTSGERAALIVTLPMTISDQEVADVMSALDHGLSAADQTLERTPELQA
jgi:4-aminobutyrate aminotransferase-like enzyme